MAGPGESRITRGQRAVRRYAAAVRLIRWLLPLAAIVVLLLIFLSGEDRQAGHQKLLSAEEVAKLGAGLSIERPRFAGTTANGQPYVLTASVARPDGPTAQVIDLDQPRGRITLSDGRVVDARSDTGLMRRAENTLTLTGDVTFTTSDGYRFTTARMLIDIGANAASSPVAVSGSGPRSEIEAGSFRLVEAKGEEGTARISFGNGVRVLFTPAPKD